MSLLDLFNGVNGEFVRVALIIPISVLMWLLSLQLHAKRKKKSYAMLSKISFGYMIFNVVSFILLLIAAVTSTELSWLVKAINAVSNSSLLVILFGFYRIHNKADIKTYILFFLPAAVCFFTGTFSIWAGSALSAISVLGITILFGKRISRGKSVWLSTGIFVFALLCSLLADLIPAISGGMNLIYSLLAPAAYVVLFATLMDHSLVIMQSSYVSAITDPLTGLFNRRYFMKYITKCVDQNIPVHIIFTDIDNFKKLNDTKGHKVGDGVLKEVATILMEEVDGLGIAGRYGGEEMVMLILNEDVDMVELTERMRRRIEQESMVTASIGYKIFESGLPPEVLIKQADEAMYNAKQTGKNKVMEYGGGSQALIKPEALKVVSNA
ncbi:MULTISPECIES: GGDEF domain-containing protein [unclassified Paenibacillus]|uniref:Diguanylate cyclase n=1 Tax=Paenibacillus provencensis TaxID=441151 RepID=A0ABW3Q3V4_9BACL|nr:MULTISPECIES: GGDEF domain-containing protein [unclassified Paenibacillus]MCM3130617.1 diguanylate cyclase [Paenibacillus sp. MER 78]SDX74371.1 diguanylate cyclase (GGDEF) domain-containing protein [Paenibacillus sp. PDC88]SFS89762.1 diguanylate cyclase (GGDEF) domain-containing protein [Paenibacillus sp. 453mf]